MGLESPAGTPGKSVEALIIVVVRRIRCRLRDIYSGVGNLDDKRYFFQLRVSYRKDGLWLTFPSP